MPALGRGLNEAAIFREVGSLLSPERAVEKNKQSVTNKTDSPGAEVKALIQLTSPHCVIFMFLVVLNLLKKGLLLLLK